MCCTLPLSTCCTRGLTERPSVRLGAIRHRAAEARGDTATAETQTVSKSKKIVTNRLANQESPKVVRTQAEQPKFSEKFRHEDRSNRLSKSNVPTSSTSPYQLCRVETLESQEGETYVHREAFGIDQRPQSARLFHSEERHGFIASHGAGRPGVWVC